MDRFDRITNVIGVIIFILSVIFMCVSGIIATIYGNGLGKLYSISLLTAFGVNITYWGIIICLNILRKKE